jgi:tRNA pseudouridine55 synthase
MYSALKKDGKRLYKLARQGEVVVREAREVTVAELELLHSEVPLPSFSVRMKVSGGTYVRVLLSDMGQRCGTCAHMTALRRTMQAHFTIDDALTEERWQDFDFLERHLAERNATPPATE